MSPRQTGQPASQSTQTGGIPATAALALGRLHPVALGFATGTICGAWGFVVTAWTVALDNPAVRRGLSLLAQYLPGYRVSAAGALLALVYGMLTGFAAGFAFAGTRNYLLAIYVRYLRRRAEREQLSEVLDRLI